jgi:hypothetical protein
MLGVFQNIDPSTPGESVPPAFVAGGGHTRWVERGWVVNIFEDARHSSVLYICKYFVAYISKNKLCGHRNEINSWRLINSIDQPKNASAVSFNQNFFYRYNVQFSVHALLPYIFRYRLEKFD